MPWSYDPKSPNMRIGEYSAQGVAPASGIVTVTLGPVRAGWTVRPTAIAVSVIGSTAQPKAAWYKNSVSPQNLGSATFTGGSGDTDNAPGVILFAGEQIVVQWTGVTPGAICYTRCSYELV